MFLSVAEELKRRALKRYNTAKVEEAENRLSVIYMIMNLCVSVCLCVCVSVCLSVILCLYI